MVSERFENVEALKRDTAVIASGLEWAGVHGNLCLGLRHPLNVGTSRDLMVRFVKRLGKNLVEWGVLTREQLELAERTEREHGSHWKPCDVGSMKSSLPVLEGNVGELGALSARCLRGMPLERVNELVDEANIMLKNYFKGKTALEWGALWGILTFSVGATLERALKEEG